MARISTLIDTAGTTVSTDTYSTALTITNVGNKIGICQVEFTAGSGTVYVQGRLAAGASYQNLTSAVTADAIIQDVPLLPDMRIFIDGPSNWDGLVFLMT